MRHAEADKIFAINFVLCAVALISMVVVALVLCIGCASSIDEQEPQQEVDDTAAPTEVEPVADPITWQEISKEIQDSLSDNWPEIEEWRLYDPSVSLLRFSKEREADPIILADEVADLANTIVSMQPDFMVGREGGIQRALLVTTDIYIGSAEVQSVPCSELIEDFDSEEGQVPRINAYVLAAMGYRESHFMKRTEVGYTIVNGKKISNCRWCRGSLGEQGMFQFMPGGWIQTFMPSGCSPFDRMCSVRGAAKALATIRCMCIDRYGQQCNTDTFVAAYGANKMPTPASARTYKGVIRAREFLCGVRQDCDELWVRDHDDAFALSL